LLAGQNRRRREKNKTRLFQGGPNRPPFLLVFSFIGFLLEMTANRPNHTGLEGRIAEIIVEPLEAQGYELVRVQVIGTEAPTVQIMADRADNAAFNLDDCTKVSHLGLDAGGQFRGD
jgi:ribosome maturation factor RimP